jgi:hypothetical protein
MKTSKIYKELCGNNANDIFNLVHVKPRAQKVQRVQKRPSYDNKIERTEVAKFTVDFAPVYQAVEQFGLRPIAQFAKKISAGDIFCLRGVMVLVLTDGMEHDRYGRKDHRVLLAYSTGTQSKILASSLMASLKKPTNMGRFVPVRFTV